jgi:hypothetical protein
MKLYGDLQISSAFFEFIGFANGLAKLRLVRLKNQGI